MCSSRKRHTLSTVQICHSFSQYLFLLVTQHQRIGELSIGYMGLNYDVATIPLSDQEKPIANTLFSKYTLCIYACSIRIMTCVAISLQSDTIHSNVYPTCSCYTISSG